MKLPKIAFSVLASCFIIGGLNAQKVEQFKKDDFRETIQLKGELLVSENLNFPVRIEVSQKDKVAFITDSKTDELVNIFDSENGAYIGGFAKKGAGPGELQIATDVEVFPKDNLVVVNGSFQRRMDFYNLSDVLKGNSPMPEKTLTFRNVPINAPRYLGNDQFLDLNRTTDGNASSRFNLINSNDKILSSHGDFPDIELPKNLENQKSEVFYAFLGANEELSHFVVAHAYTDIIEVYDRTFKLVNRTQGPEGFNPAASLAKVGGNATIVAPTQGSRMAYTTPVVGKDRFFVLFSGESTSTRGYHQTQILSFDLTGKPLETFELDVPIFAFDIDWSSNTLYGISHEAPFDDAEVAVVKFLLSK